MFSFFVTVLAVIQVIATSGGQSVSDERNQQVRMIQRFLDVLVETLSWK